MELITAVLIAGPLGYLVCTRRNALGAYLVLWAIVFSVQTPVVHHENPDDINAAYFVVNAAILAGGVCLNSLGVWLRARRVRTTDSAGSA